MTKDEEIAVLVALLEQAHDLLRFVVRYDGKTTPEFVARCREFVEDEFSGHEQDPKTCAHVPMKAALDDSVHCIRCCAHLGSAN